MTRARRGVILGALLSFFISKTTYAAGPTLIPKKIGQTIIWRGRKYTAIKFGKKLIWNQGVPITAVKPTPDASPSSFPSTTPSVSASKTPSLNIVGKSSELNVGDTKIFHENDPYGRGAKYVITRTKDGLVAFDNTCTHEGCSVEQILAANNLRCACHGAEYNAITGAATKKPAYDPLKQVKVSEVNGEILIG